MKGFFMFAVAAVVFCVIVFAITKKLDEAFAITKELDEADKKVRMHVEPTVNIVCLTYRDAMQCFPYTDEGTHLDTTPPGMSL